MTLEQQQPESRTTNTTNWHILGAGAIGCLWAGELFQRGISTTLLVKPERLATLPSPASLTFTNQHQTIDLPVTIQATSHNQPISHLLVTTKAGDTLTALETIRHRLTGCAQITLLQNGLGSQQQVARAFPEKAIYAGSTTDGAWTEHFLHVHRAGNGHTWLGPLNNKAKDHWQNSDIQQLTQLPELSVHLTDCIMHKLQEKLAINSAINALAALHQCPNGELLKEQFQPMIARLCGETESILAADGYKAESPLHDTVNKVLTLTAKNYNSTLQDVHNKRPTELPWINGYLLQKAEQYGIPAPCHTQLMQSLARKNIC